MTEGETAIKIKKFPEMKSLSWGNARPEQVIEHRKVLLEWYEKVYQWRVDTTEKLQKRYKHHRLCSCEFCSFITELLEALKP